MLCQWMLFETLSLFPYSCALVYLHRVKDISMSRTVGAALATPVRRIEKALRLEPTIIALTSEVFQTPVPRVVVLLWIDIDKKI